MLKAVIFDMDDTLLNWNERTENWSAYHRIHLKYVADYINTFFSAHQLDFEAFFQVSNDLIHQTWQHALQTLEAPHLGHILQQALDMLCIEKHPQITPDTLIDAYQWRGVPGVKAFPESVEVLNTLKSHGLKIGLVTNAFQPMRIRTYELEVNGLLPFFDSMISAADVGVLKPHKRIFEQALEELNIEANEAVFVGDSLEADIVGAQNVGMFAILRRIEDKVLSYQNGIRPNAEITSLDQLFEIFDTHYDGWKNQS
ncbi:MAG: hypothetical protein CUN55_01315 [Phototrophicales bacterium]|nr:MAG: hypothetical protein CUN55_01315 [Phototrophicales bacterium]